MRTRCRPALFVVALLSAACAGAESYPVANSNDHRQSGSQTAADPALVIAASGLQQGCFYARDVSNWEALNREYLIAYAPNRNRAFLVRFSPPASELRSASTIAFAGRDRICGRAGERLVIGRSSGRSIAMDYSILDVWGIDAATAERLRENRKGRESAKVEVAKESPGAVVETDIRVSGEDGSGEGTEATELE